MKLNLTKLIEERAWDRIGIQILRSYIRNNMSYLLYYHIKDTIFFYDENIINNIWDQSIEYIRKNN
jgi:hypothetical protein